MPDQLTPEEEQKRLDIIQKQGVAAKDLASTYEKIEKTLGKLTADEKESLDIAKQLVGQSANLEKNIQNRINKTGSIKDLTKSLLQVEQDYAKIVAKEGKLLKDKEEAIYASQRARLKEIQQTESLNTLLGETDEAIRRRNKAEDEGNSNLVRQLNAEIKSNQYIIEQNQKQLKLTTQQKEEQRALAVQLDIAGKTQEKLKEQQEEEIALTKQELKARNGIAALDVLKEKFNVKQIADLFTTKGLFLAAIEAALRFNETSVKISKNIGYGADNADRLTSKLKQTAQTSGNLNVTLKNASEAMSELNSATGGVAEYSSDALTTQIMLTKQLGLSGEEAAGIYKFSVLTGKSSEKVNDEMVAAFVNTRNTVKGSADFKTTMAAASKVSGQLSANLQNNPGLITKAVVQAQAFGTSLEQINTQGASLLNWESSLNSELDAELLTGKQLNLEKARAAALTGDQITLAEELNKNVGTLSEYQSMNVLQQNALAAAVGLTSDQLSDQLRKQKIATEQGKSLAQITKEEALEAENRQAIQEKFNAAILKLQDFFGNLVAGPVGKFLSMLSDSLGIIEGIGIALGAVYVVSKAITITQALSTALKTEEAIATGTTNLLLGARTAIMNSQLGILVAQATAAVIANPLLGLVGLAAAVGVAGLIYSSMNDGMIGPGGETIVSGPKGSIQLNKEDSIVAGTDLFSGKKGGESIQGPSIDLTPMIMAINAVKASVDRLYGKDSSVHMGGKKVGTTLAQGSHKVA